LPVIDAAERSSRGVFPSQTCHGSDEDFDGGGRTEADPSGAVRWVKRSARKNPGTEWFRDAAEATGFEPAISALTGPRVRPLHHASALSRGEYGISLLPLSRGAVSETWGEAGCALVRLPIRRNWPRNARALSSPSSSYVTLASVAVRRRVARAHLVGRRARFSPR
jgi:hypothetical protein